MSHPSQGQQHRFHFLSQKYQRLHRCARGTVSPLSLRPALAASITLDRPHASPLRFDPEGNPHEMDLDVQVLVVSAAGCCCSSLQGRRLTLPLR